MPIDLLHDDLGRIARDGVRDDIVAAVRGVAEWNDELATAADYLLRQRVVAHLRERPPLAELIEEARMIDRILDPVLQEALAGVGGWFARWRGYETLLSGHASALRLRDPEAVLTKAHVPEILAHVGERPERFVRQRSLGDDLGIKPQNLTRILQFMEAHDLIVRTSVGTEKLVALGPTAPARAVEQSRRAPRKHSPYLLEMTGTPS